MSDSAATLPARPADIAPFSVRYGGRGFGWYVVRDVPGIATFVESGPYTTKAQAVSAAAEILGELRS